MANDGASVGHVTRAVAVARALVAAAAGEGLPLEVLLATTSAADAVVAWSGLPAVRLPPAGLLPDEARRALAAGVLRGVLAGFAPDLLVVDTFPSGSQLELAGLLDEPRWRVLVRRTVREDRAAAAVVAAGLDRYDRIVVPGDPAPAASADPRVVAVPPIVLVADPLPPDEARAALGSAARVVVSCGGRADPATAALAEAARRWCAERGEPEPLVAPGLLDAGVRPVPYPLGLYLRAFDLAVGSAGYNTAHECAVAGVPAVLHPRPRAYDDQAARARRFEAAGLGIALDDPSGLPAALERASALARSRIPGDGTARAAGALLELVRSG